MPENPLQVDAADPDAVKAAQDRAKHLAYEALLFWRGVFSERAGRAEMWKILNEAGAFDERFACGPGGFPQPEATWFNAGQKSFALRLYHTWLRVEPGGVMLMLQENAPWYPTESK